MALSNAAKIGICWSICVSASFYLFYLSKQSVVQKRYRQMKEREQQRALHRTVQSE